MSRKTTHVYQVSFRGTRAEMLAFEKLLENQRMTIEDMQEWDEVNDEDNPPSGVVQWSKFRWLKFSEVIKFRKRGKNE